MPGCIKCFACCLPQVIKNIFCPPSVAVFVNDLSVLFGGPPEYIDCGDCWNVDGTNPFSVSLWFKSTEYGTLIGRQNAEIEFSGWALTLIPGGILSFQLIHDFNIPQSMLEVQVDESLDDGVWHHVLVTYNGSGVAAGVNIYVDGSLRSPFIIFNTLMGPTSSPNTYLGIGHVEGNETFYFRGNIDEVSLYSKELSPAEDTYIYNGGQPNDLSAIVILPLNVSWWRMGDGDTYPIIQDVKENHFNGTMIAMEAGDIVEDTPPS